MSSFNNFKRKLSSDKKLQTRMKEASTIKDVVEIAASVGFNVSEREVKDDIMEAISGGTTGFNPISGALGAAGGMGINVGVGDVDFSMFDFSKYDASISQAISGDGSTANNVGHVSIGRDKTTSK